MVKILSEMPGSLLSFCKIIFSPHMHGLFESANDKPERYTSSVQFGKCIKFTKEKNKSCNVRSYVTKQQLHQ
jgi:hypothetical protein